MLSARGWFVLAAMVIAIPLGAVKVHAQPTPDELNNAAATSDWLHSNHDYAGQRFVGLAGIHKGNVGRLAPVCSFDAQDYGHFYTAPIVHRGVLYFTAALSTIALDAATCALIWRHEYKLQARWVWSANRGVALGDGLVLRGTTDGYLLALDAKTGALRWQRAIASAAAGETLTMAPVIFDDLVIIGTAGSENAIQGWVGAFRLSDGWPFWRFNTVPRPGEPGADSWRPEPGTVVGGGGVWTPFSIDAAAGLLYVAVGNPAPDLLGDARPGDNLYTNAMVVLDIRSGELQWYHQMVPHDVHDWDLTQVSPLFSAHVAGQIRKLVATVGKSGLLRVIDRERRTTLYEVAVSRQKNTALPVTTEGVYACPGPLGGVQWNDPAYNPSLNTLYIPSVDWCGTYHSDEKAVHVPGQEYMGGWYMPDSLDKSNGWLTAIDGSTGAIRWRYRSERPMLGAVTATMTGLVFTGELTGDFLALDGNTGAVLFRHDLGGTIAGGIISYAVGDRQYVAVTSGTASRFWRAPSASAKITVFGLP